MRDELELQLATTPTGTELLGDAPSSHHRFRSRFFRQPFAVASLIFLAAVVVSGIFAPQISPADPLSQDLGNILAPPSSDHLLGTDNLGRDLLSRVLYGSRVTMVAVAQALGLAIVLGIPLGLLVGYQGGHLEAVVMRVTDAFMSFPNLLLAIAVVGVLGPGLTNAMVALGVTFAPRFLRLARAAALDVREDLYVKAAISIGCSTFQTLRRHILPNVLGPLLIQTSVFAGQIMLIEASLSFLGLGVQPPQASWGAILQSASPYIESHPTFILFPGLAITLCVLALNLLGDGLRDSIGRDDTGLA